MSFEDKAQEVELQAWEQNNALRQSIRRYTPSEDGYGPEHCIECGDDMPDVRRSMGSHLCTTCKQREEGKARMLRS